MRSEDHLVRQGPPSALAAQSAYHTLKGFLGSPWAPSAFVAQVTLSRAQGPLRGLRGPSGRLEGPKGPFVTFHFFRFA